MIYGCAHFATNATNCRRFEMEEKTVYLVTGGAGFIGSHLVQALVKRGQRVRVLDDFSSGSRENLSPVTDSIEVITGDVADPKTVRRATAGVSYVLHQAAIASVQQSLVDPVGTNRTNVLGTLNVLLAAHESRVLGLTFASSAAVYGDPDELPVQEKLPTHPLSPYAATKAAGEGYVHAFVASFGVPAVILRYFNVYGPRQDPDSPYSGVISKFGAALAAGKPPTIFGDGLQTRDFVFVGDVVRANLLACKNAEAHGQAFNIASGRQISILRLAETVGTVMGRQLAPDFAPARSGEVRLSQADVSHAKETLGWQAETDLETGIEQTARWLAQTTAH
jgi:UDP-glucose 4-epimerase